MCNPLLALLTLLAAYLSDVSGQINQVIGVATTVNSPTHVTIAWFAIPQAVKYQIALKEIPDRVSTIQNITNSASRFEFTTAKSGTIYHVNVRAVSANGEVSNWSTTEILMTFGPKPIKLLQVPEIDVNFVTLKWDVYVDAGVPDYYKISYRNNDNGVVIYEPNVNSNQRTYKIQNLIGNTPYTISMMAVKAHVNSSVVSQEFRTILQYLRKIEDVRVTDISATTVTISWSKPAKVTYVEYYEIKLNTGDESQIYQTSNNQTIDHKIIDNLSPGVVYYCRVRTSIDVNGNVYKGDWSNQIYFTTILPDFKQITGLTFSEKTATGALIKWSTHASYPIPIETYQILYYGEDNIPVVINSSSTETEYRITNLVSSMNYTFQVRAVDVRGRHSKYSTSENFQTIGPKPASSMDITNITNNAVRVSWTVLGNDSIILRLRNNENNEFQPDIVIDRASAPTRVLTGLKPNNPYTVFLYTKNVHESSPIFMGFRTGLQYSAVLPTNVQATQENPLGTILLSCDYIFSTVKYRVKIQQKEGSEELTITDYNVKTDVTTDTVNNRQTIRIKVKTGYTYDIQMASVVNEIIVSDFSAIKTEKIGGGRPATAITIFDKSENSFKVTWQSNYRQSGEHLHYIVSLYDNNINIERKQTTYNYTPLLFNRNILSNTPYRITIQSKSPYDDKYGDVVEFPFVMPKGRPHAPLFVSTAPQDFSVTISWQPIPRRDDIAYYEIAIYEKDARSTNRTYRTSNGAVHAYTIASDLHPGKLYIAQVRGVASTSDKFDHEGVWSTQQHFSVYGFIGKQPKHLITNVQENSVTITWNMSDESDIKLYEIQYQTDRQETIIKTNSASKMYTITGLQSNQTYDIRVRAVTKNDQRGEWSLFINAHTGQEGESPTEPENGSSNSRLIDGIVIGVILLILIVAIAAMFIIPHLRRKRIQRYQDGSLSFSNNSYEKKEDTNGYTNNHAINQAATQKRIRPASYS